MLAGIPLLLLIGAAIAFIVIMGSYFKVNPFVVLLLAALLTGAASGLPLTEIAQTANEGFGNMMKKIGLIVILGTLIGTVLEKTGSIEKIAGFILKLFGEGRPIAAITVIGAVVGIPIFCDSGYIILSGLTRPLAENSKKNHGAIVCGLASGLYITHTLLPPHPGSLAGAANLGLKDHYGLVIAIGMMVAIPVTLIAWWFSSNIASKIDTPFLKDETILKKSSQKPVWKCLLPVVVPLLLIALASLGLFLHLPENFRKIMEVLGNPTIALLLGFGLSLWTVEPINRHQLQEWIKEGIVHAGSILVIVGAGGVLGEILKKTDLASFVKNFSVIGGHNQLLFLFIAWCMGVLLKTAQGSTTSAIIVVSSILAPLSASVGFSSPLELSLLLAAIAGGTMMVSHSNDAYFWVIAQFSGMGMKQTYSTFSLATLFMGTAALATVLLLALFFL